MNKYDYAMMDTAIRWSECSTANRLKVGCVIAKDNRIISIGYNGLPKGLGNMCEDMEGKSKSEVIHAEHNAILFAAKEGISINGATVYVTHRPCNHCLVMMEVAGISKVIYKNEYVGSKGADDYLLAQLNIEIVKM